GQGAHRDPGALGQRRQGDVALAPQRPQPRANRAEHGAEVGAEVGALARIGVHPSILPERQLFLPIAGARRQGGGMSHSTSHDEPIEFTQECWDNRYRSAGQLWSGQPNAQFAAQAADLDPGVALDAGCGEGADAIWLARRGWTVTAVDVSAVALERGKQA